MIREKHKSRDSCLVIREKPWRAVARAALLSPAGAAPTGADEVFAPSNGVITLNLNRLPAKKRLTCISHHTTVEARDTTARTSLRLLAVLNVLSSTPARAKPLAPRPDGLLTHFTSPRSEKCRLKGFSTKKAVIRVSCLVIRVS